MEPRARPAATRGPRPCPQTSNVATKTDSRTDREHERRYTPESNKHLKSLVLAFEPETQRGSEYPKPLDRMISLLGMVEQQPLVDVFGNAMQVAGQAYNQILFAFDVVQPALWAASGKLREYAAANLSDPEQVEFCRLMAELVLWSQVTGQPLL